jgi:ABC-type polysaccharide/polyol phosphate transport system ATPase subunit
MDSSIELDNISKSFDIKSKDNNLIDNSKLKALTNISLKIPKGKTIALLGPNGSGKTTLLRIISGIYQPDSGSVHINGRLAPLLQIGTGFNVELNAIENIKMYGMLLGFSKNEIEKKINPILEFAELEKFSKMKLKTYSSGMRARLGFATALQIDPDILLVDEVLAVGDESFRKKSFREFFKFKERGKTVVLTTHNLNWVSKYADYAVLLSNGNLVEIGTPDIVLDKYQKMIDDLPDKK